MSDSSPTLKPAIPGLPTLPATAKVTDPVCGMTVDPARAAGHVDHDGTTYYFCSNGCVARFSAEGLAR